MHVLTHGPRSYIDAHLSLFPMHQHTVDYFADAEDTLEATRNYQPDLIFIADAEDNGTDATFFIVRKLRKTGFAGLIVVALASNVAESWPPAIFNAGADDILYGKRPSELAARFDALLRRHRINEPVSLITHGNTAVDNDPQIHIDGAPFSISPREHLIMREMMLKPRRTVSRDQILNAIGRNEIEYIRTIDVYIGRIRKILQDGGSNLSITTVRNQGYRLDLPAC